MTINHPGADSINYYKLVNTDLFNTGLYDKELVNADLFYKSQLPIFRNKYFCFPIRYKFPLIFLKKLRFGQILSWHTSHYIFLCLMIHISERFLCIYFILAKNFFHLQVAYLKFLIPAFNIIFFFSFQYPPINSIDQDFIILKPPFMNFIFFAPQIIYSYHFSNLLLFTQ